MNKVADGCHVACSYLIDYLMTGKQEVTAHSLINSSNRLRRVEAQPRADGDPELSVRFYCPLVELLTLKKEDMSALISALLVLPWLRLVTLKVTNRKKMASAASSDGDTCSVVFISRLKGIGKLQHLLTQISAGFIYQTLQSTTSYKAGLLHHVWKSTFRVEFDK